MRDVSLPPLGAGRKKDVTCRVRAFTSIDDDAARARVGLFEQLVCVLPQIERSHVGPERLEERRRALRRFEVRPMADDDDERGHSRADLSSLSLGRASTDGLFPWRRTARANSTGGR